MPSLDELRRQLAEKDKKAAEVRAQIAMDTARAKQQKELRARMENLSEHEKQRARAVFTKYFDRSGAGALNAAALVEISKAEERMRPLTVEEAAASIKVLDYDGDGFLDFNEFCQWWVGAAPSSAGMSMLRSILKVRDAHDALKKTIEKELIAAPQLAWAPRADVHSEVTVGDIDEAFAPKAAIYAAVLPSSKLSVDGAISGILHALHNEDGHEDDGNDTDDFIKARNFQGVLTARFAVAPTADLDDVETAMELLKAVYEEYNAQDETPVDVRAAFDSRKREIAVHVFLRGPSEANPESVGDPSAVMLQQLRLPQETLFFDKFLAGVELGDVEALSINSGKPLISLLDKARVVVHGRVADGVVELADRMLFEQIKDSRPTSRGNRKKYPKLVMSRLLRGFGTNHSFRSPGEVLRSIIDEFIAYPETAATLVNKRDGSTFTAEDVEAVQREQGDFRAVVTALLQKVMPWDYSLRDLLGWSKTDDVLGEVADVPRFVVIGADSHFKRAFPTFVPPEYAAKSDGVFRLRVPGSRPDDKGLYKVRAVGFNVTDKPSLVPGIEPGFAVALVDASSEAALQQSLSTLATAVRLMPKDIDILAVAVDVADKSAEEIEAHVRNAVDCTDREIAFHVEGEALQETMLKALRAKGDFGSAEGDEAEGDGEDDEEPAAPEQQVLQTLAFALRKVVSHVIELNATTTVADVKVQLDSLPLISAIPTTAAELAQTRLESRHALRGYTKSIGSDALGRLKLVGTQLISAELMTDIALRIKKEQGEEVDEDEVARERQERREAILRGEESSSDARRDDEGERHSEVAEDEGENNGSGSSSADVREEREARRRESSSSDCESD